jgi:hypothetical protein
VDFGPGRRLQHETAKTKNAMCDMRLTVTGRALYRLRNPIAAKRSAVSGRDVFKG